MMHGTKKQCLEGGQWPYSDPGKRPVEATPEGATSMVNLNVGGVTYTTTFRTLLRHVDSRFGVYFRQLHAHLTQGVPVGNIGDDFVYIASENSAYPTVFIDRDGRRFGYILDYLRDGDVVLPDDTTLCRQLLQDARYFRLPGLEHMLNTATGTVSLQQPPTVMTPTRNLVSRSSDPIVETMHSLPPDPSVLTPGREIFNVQCIPNVESTLGNGNIVDDSQSLFYSQRSYDEDAFSSQKSYLQVDENDNIEDSGVFIQTTQVSQMGNLEFSTSMDF
ncbi:K+ channel tetramerisation domain containing protein [Babesia ovis]|uniref:K+ channel tetramerisation domain containing protein n=1 Tax=Babesia ovis TaxID=5869 RepID=A0A9W5TAY2_BABOV|nr:K+ channel tetramerisation domain containing protein [Babesia ovis]